MDAKSENESGESSRTSDESLEEESGDYDQVALSNGEYSRFEDMVHGDTTEQIFQGSESNADSEDGDYTESDSEGEESYKVGGYHPVRVGEVYKDRYKVVSKLGWGHFSTVWLALDLMGTETTRRTCYVALKVQKSATHYTEAAYDEIELLTSARNNRNNPIWKKSRDYYIRAKLCPDASVDPEYAGVVSLCDYFETVGPNGVHVCMVFETMGPNVLTLIKKYDFKGVPTDTVHRLATDCLVGLDYLHRVCGIIHTDMKPETVLVSCPAGVPVSKTGQPLIPLDKPIEATGQHFADLPSPTSAHKQSPRPPVSPNTAVDFRVSLDEEPERVPDARDRDSKPKLTRNQKRKLAKKRRVAAAAKSNSGTVTSETTPSVAEMASATPESSVVTVTRRRKGKKRGPPRETTGAAAAAAPSPPYVKGQLKPSRSDPSLLSFYNKQGPVLPGRMPYHHPRSLLTRAKNLTKNGSLTSSVSTAATAPVAPVTEETIASLDIFDHPSVTYKIADLGNACWVDRHFSEEIQTRQYRSPEVLIGSGYDTSADIWSLACMIFELVTGDYLFDPKGSDEYPRDEDHLALIMELLGPLPEDMIAAGKKSKTYFNRKGELRHIKQLRQWGLEEVLYQKYRVPKTDAKELAAFLAPMLILDPKQRATAKDLLKHSWVKQRTVSGATKARVPAPVVITEPADEGEEVPEEDHPSVVMPLSPGYSSARSELV